MFFEYKLNIFNIFLLCKIRLICIYIGVLICVGDLLFFFFEIIIFKINDFVMKC